MNNKLELIPAKKTGQLIIYILLEISFTTGLVALIIYIIKRGLPGDLSSYPANILLIYSLCYGIAMVLILTALLIFLYAYTYYLLAFIRTYNCKTPTLILDEEKLYYKWLGPTASKDKEFTLKWFEIKDIKLGAEYWASKEMALPLRSVFIANTYWNRYNIINPDYKGVIFNKYVIFNQFVYDYKYINQILNQYKDKYGARI